MNDKEIFDKIVQILVDEFEIDKDNIRVESQLYTDFELDSLDSVDLVVALEKKFSFKIDRANDGPLIAQIRTVADIIGFVKSKAETLS